MNIDDVQQWCQAKGVDAKMIVRGAEFSIRHDAQGSKASFPSMKDLLHWELIVEGKRCPTSPSDMERLVTGKMPLEGFLGRIREYLPLDKA